MNQETKLNSVAASPPASGSAPWGWAYAPDSGSETWHGPYSTRAEAIEELFSYYEDGGYISHCRPVEDGDEVADEDWTFICTGEPERIEPNNNYVTPVTYPK